MRINDFYPRSAPGLLIWRWIWGPISLAAAFVPLLCLNLLQFPSLLLLPFSKKLFRQYNRTAAWLVWGWWAWAVQRLIGLRVHVTGEVMGVSENTILIANHQGMGDILVLLCLALDKKRIGDIKWLVKDVLKYVPGLGWGMLFIECVFLKRSWSKDESKIVRAFSKFKTAQMPLWLIMFPEGTRLKPEKLKSSQTHAKEKGLEVFSHVLIPRTKGFYTALVGLRGYVQNVYSVTIAYPGTATPSLVRLIRGDVKDVYCHVRKVPLSTIPEDPSGVGQWLLQDFTLKERLLSGFVQTGKLEP